MRVIPLKDRVLADEIDHGNKVVNGIILTDDNMKERGIRPRWCRIYDVGENIKDIKPGQYVLMEHTRWTIPVKITNEKNEEVDLRLLDYPKAALAVSNEKFY